MWSEGVRFVYILLRDAFAWLTYVAEHKVAKDATLCTDEVKRPVKDIYESQPVYCKIIELYNIIHCLLKFVDVFSLQFTFFISMIIIYSKLSFIRSNRPNFQNFSKMYKLTGKEGEAYNIPMGGVGDGRKYDSS